MVLARVSCRYSSSFTRSSINSYNPVPQCRSLTVEFTIISLSSSCGPESKKKWSASYCYSRFLRLFADVAEIIFFSKVNIVPNWASVEVEASQAAMLFSPGSGKIFLTEKIYNNNAVGVPRHLSSPTFS